jgi:hypothetical protein
LSELEKARKALDNALDELAAAASSAAGGGSGDTGDMNAALRDAEAERDDLAKQLVDMQAERAKDAAMIEDALADLRAIA